MPNPELTGLAVVVLVLVVILSTWYGRARRRPRGPDVGLAVFDVDGDINAPSLDVIDAALMMTTDPGGRDYLLDKRIDAMRRAG